MNVTVITGSAHRHGTSALLADKFIEGAKEAGHEVFRFDAAFKNIHGCIGCDTCNKKADGCVFKDDMEELNPHLLESDVIVFASPIYYFNINAQLKSVIDRFYANNSALQQEDSPLAHHGRRVHGIGRRIGAFLQTLRQLYGMGEPRRHFIHQQLDACRHREYGFPAESL